MRRYVGSGAYLAGIPARDLTDQEWDDLTPEQREHARKLYAYRKSDKETVSDRANMDQQRLVDGKL